MTNKQEEFDFGMQEFDWQRDPRDKSPLDMVQEFAGISGQIPDAKLYATLIAEETEEFEEAQAVKEDEEVLKELCDIVYVTYGYANARGWDLDTALSRVHENNLGRMYQPNGEIERRADGKIIKNKNYPKVDLKDLV